MVSTGKEINFDSYLTPYTNINLKSITALNVKAETIKFPGGNIGEKSLWPGNIQRSLEHKKYKQKKKTGRLHQIYKLLFETHP